MRIFWKKAVKSLRRRGLCPEPLSASSGWGLFPQTPAFFLPPINIALSSAFLSLNVRGILLFRIVIVVTKSKCSAIASSTPCASFHFKLCSFCWWGRKNILCPRAQGTLTTPLIDNIFDCKIVLFL